ncbi:hypothetical protein ACI2S3_08405 [Ralstonia nicotianae]
MEDLNQVAATLAAAIYTSDRAAAITTAIPTMAVMRSTQTKRIVELYWDVRQQLIETHKETS